MQPPDYLNEPLLKFAGEDIAFTVADACTSALVIGNTGSGKTSAVGKTLCTKLMDYGYGMLVLTSKKDEADLIKFYAQQSNRSHDIVEIKPNGSHAFNFMEYESTVRSDTSYARNLLDLLKVVIHAGEDRNEDSETDPFWRNSQEQLIKNTIQLLLLAYGKVTVPLLFEIAQSTPYKEKEETNKKSSNEENEPNAFDKAMQAAKQNIKQKVDAWKEQLGTNWINKLTDEEYLHQLQEAIPEYRTFKMVNQFFMEGLYNISEKTRGIIILSLTSFLSNLMDDPIYDLFCNKPSTVTPESCIHEGKIVIVNIPVDLYDRIAKDCQTMCKYIFQKAWQRRNLNENSRPVAIYADEFQNFTHPLDHTLLATARSNCISTIYLTQNLPAIYANMGGSSHRVENKVKSLLSLLSTKFFLCNNCPDTNAYASTLIGKSYVKDQSVNFNAGEKINIGGGAHYILEDMVRPEQFSKLKTGGERNKYMVECIIHMQGKVFRSGSNHKKIMFYQR